MVVSPLDGYPRGSGVIVSRDHVLTVAHVVEGIDSVAVFFRSTNGDHQTAWGAVVSRRPGDLDIAVLKVEVPRGYSPAEVSCEPLSLGDPVRGINHTEPFRWAYAAGTVAVVNRSAGAKDTEAVLAMPSGMGASGGPVFDSDGALVGIVTGWAVQFTTSSDPPRLAVATGFTFMVPMDQICKAGVPFLPDGAQP